MDFVKTFGVNICGGCCGTTPEHIKLVADAVRRAGAAAARCIWTPDGGDGAGDEPVFGGGARQDTSILIIGERTNTNGSKKFKEALIAGDFDTLTAMGASR